MGRKASSSSSFSSSSGEESGSTATPPPPGTKANGEKRRGGKKGIKNGTNDHRVIIRSRDAWPKWAKCVVCWDKKTENVPHTVEGLKPIYGDSDFLILDCTHFVCSKECLEKCRTLPSGFTSGINI